MGHIPKVEQAVPGLNDTGLAQRQHPGDEPLFGMIQ
jgi:hypothetical protein